MASAIVTKRADEKRRITLPAEVIGEDGKVLFTLLEDVAVIAKNKDRIGAIHLLLERVKSERKLKALGEWEELLRQTGLMGLTSRTIEAKVGLGMRRPAGTQG